MKSRFNLVWRLLWWFCAALLFAAVAPRAFAQETVRPAPLDAITIWKIVNTALFILGLGWLAWKYGPAFFNARSASIQKAIQDATGLKIEADFRYSEIDRKMAGLAEEIRKIRQQAAVERERDHAHFRRETQIEIEHIHRNVLADIEAFRQESTLKLRRHTAQLALRLTERQLRERFQSGEPQDLLHDFIHLVEQGKN